MREADAYVFKRGVPFVILRPGPLSDKHARGGIALADENTFVKPAVSRDTVAQLARRCITLDARNRVIGFVDGDMTIDAVLETMHQATPTSR